ncbi:MAG: hypothetical protein HDR80_04975 [Bacteroides sp.]|nr:hypothetical protein [Bacteroides sp.]
MKHEIKHRIPYRYLPLLTLTALLAAACASIGNPSGGPRDEDPPRFLHGNPAPGATDVPVDLQRLNLDFDEIIVLKDAFSKVVVSPPSKSVPRVTSQGHRVTVNFTDSLLPNTTYTIDFADAITDNNEGNPLESFAYTFSTGPTVDSLRIAGRVLSAEKMEPMQGKIVGIHSVDRDTVVFARPFERVARTDDRGRFSIEGLPEGTYRVYALDDANSDYIYSSPDEEMAFYETTVTPSTTAGEAQDTIFNPRLGTVDSVVTRRRTIYLPNDILLRSFVSSRLNRYITDYQRADSTALKLTFSAPMQAPPEFALVDYRGELPDDWYILERSLHSDTVTLWLNDPQLVNTDTLRLAVGYLTPDTLNHYALRTDTLRLITTRATETAKKSAKALKATAREAKKNGGETPDSVSPEIPRLGIDFPGGSAPEPGRPITFRTATPLARLDSAAFHLEMKKDTVWTRVADLRPASDTLDPRRFTLSYPWAYDTQYRLLVDSLAMQGIYGLETAPVSREFKTKAEKEYCSIAVSIPDWPAGLPAFVDLLSASDTPVARQPLGAGGSVIFRHLNPGKYYLRITEDLDGDMAWTTGDIFEHRQPEAAYYYPKAINIKANWNKEETWRVFDTPADAMKPDVLLKNKPTQRANRNGSRKQASGGEEEDEDDDYELPW